MFNLQNPHAKISNPWPFLFIYLIYMLFHDCKKNHLIGNIQINIHVIIRSPINDIKSFNSYITILNNLRIVSK